MTVDPGYIAEADYDGDGKNSKKEMNRYRKSGRSETDFASRVGAAYAVIKQDPELYQWFQGKTREYLDNPTAFSEAAFFNDLDQQPFAQKYSKAAIADMDFELRYPQVYADQLNSQVETLRDQAVRAGATKLAQNDQELRDLAKRSRRMGLNQAQIQNTIAGYIEAVDGRYTGDAAQIEAGLKDWARRNGVGLSTSLVADYVRKIQSGDTTEFDVLQDLRRTYMSGAYPAWADRIDSGMDIYDIASPYRKKMADLLEIGEETIDMNDGLLQRGLQGVGADGKPSVVPLYEFERQVREDPRWQYTDNAYSTYTDVGTKLLQMFGFR
jgi:predicted transcriptional regulator with HTH domain